MVIGGCMKWYHACFDSNWVRCSNCKHEFTREHIEKKRKCPNCKMDNKGQIKKKKELIF